MTFDSPILAPSLLAADFTKLGDEIQACLDSEIRWLHCDIMDGKFVPNISYGPFVVEAIRRAAPETFLDVHLMIENPDAFVEPFADAGANLISVHQETCPHLHRTIQHIKNQGCLSGVVINPATPVDTLYPIFEDVDLVLVMSVNPGFGGQSFIESSLKKIYKLNEIRKQTQMEFLIQVDGGVNRENCTQLVRKGADVLVAGSSVFKQESISEAIQGLRSKMNAGRADLV
ncbi:ribulose-phosphate 3-epimerase [Rhodohalobacter sp. SW132]|uniref:ribulose-phosphate 3-epimerase n=1 Tax=Rhodohalobacter sp. SW132 TaxID=2293433 RepID=UPI000E225FD9|nr:ribulose-phosphate 3-epimerase [Rhodohalobacter sp. SW132]REL33283.1 ribulose-phosphate 3-epimerase [Rhodohalobacter sp. SW132]